CPKCKCGRLKSESLAVCVGDKTIADVTKYSGQEVQEFFSKVELTEKQHKNAHLILREIQERVGCLVNVGLDYLTLSRAAGTLSG
ncbi:hypothetical protein, partial [Bacillus sp. BML-BC060]|uniref:hypothetical protein n=1 Tax=Bacillus sp. BML-BC060 TaxID=2842487 RepID=UPI001C80796F